MIAGFELPDRWRRAAAGQRRQPLAPYDRDVNTVFQDYALFPHMTRAREHRVRAQGEGRRQGRASPARRRDARGRAPRGVRRATTRSAQRRSASAHRAGPGAGQPSEGAAARRTARRARPQAARGDAGRVEVDPARRRHHLRLRHPRSGRGVVDEQSHRRVQQGPHRAGRHTREIYDHPATRFVAGFVGTSNVLDRRAVATVARRRGAALDPPRTHPHRQHEVDDGGDVVSRCGQRHPVSWAPIVGCVCNSTTAPPCSPACRATGSLVLPSAELSAWHGRATRPFPSPIPTSPKGETHEVNTNGNGASHLVDACQPSPVAAMTTTAPTQRPRRLRPRRPTPPLPPTRLRRRTRRLPPTPLRRPTPLLPAARSTTCGPRMPTCWPAPKAVNMVAWPGYIEDGTHQSRRRLGDAVHRHDRVRRQVEARRDQRRDGATDAER